MIEDHDQDFTEEPTPAHGRRSRPRLATVLAVLCVLTFVGGLAMGLYLRSKGSEEDARQQDRVEVVQAAQRFTETWNTFTPEDADAYVQRVSPLLSTKFRSEFTKASEDVVGGIQQQKLSSTGKVLPDSAGIPLVAVASLDKDSAEVLVVSDAERVAGGQNVLRHWRWQVHLVKVDGQWLVDGFDEA